MRALPLTITAGARCGYCIWQTMDDQQDPLFVAGLSSKQEVMDFIAGLLADLEGHDVANDPRDMARRFSSHPQPPKDEFPYTNKTREPATNGANALGSFIQRIIPTGGEQAHVTA